MFDTIGRITVPTVTNSGLTLPLTTRYPFGSSVELPHRWLLATTADSTGGPEAENVRRYSSGLPLMNVVDKQRGY